MRAILFTHWHADHVGGAAALHRRSGARTVAHTLDAPVIGGAAPMPLTRLQKLDYSVRVQWGQSQGSSRWNLTLPGPP